LKGVKINEEVKRTSEKEEKEERKEGKEIDEK
jgi:hypothetical protein